MPFRPRVAVVGVGHYHATYAPFYLSLLTKHGARLVGVSDPESGVAELRGAPFGAPAFADYRRMIEETKPEFVLALGRHVDMPEEFRFLVEAGVPFVMEKPWAIDAGTVRELASLAEARGAWVAAPWSMRYSIWAEAARRAIEDGSSGKVSHIRFRMVRPGVQRYVDQGCEWMLRKAAAGGGVLLNLGVHGFDLCRWLTGEEPEVVSAVVSNAVYALDIEDYASVTLRTPSGIVFHNEVGYTYPQAGGGDDERTLAAERALYREEEGILHIVTADADEVRSPAMGEMTAWEGVVVDCLRRVEHGEPPPNTPNDCTRAVELTFEAYRKAGVTA
jgi:predicted dehydrogenase